MCHGHHVQASAAKEWKSEHEVPHRRASGEAGLAAAAALAAVLAASASCAACSCFAMSMSDTLLGRCAATTSGLTPCRFWAKLYQPDMLRVAAGSREDSHCKALKSRWCPELPA